MAAEERTGDELQLAWLVTLFVFLNLDRERKDTERMAILCLQDLKDLDEILYFISMGAIYILED